MKIQTVTALILLAVSIGRSEAADLESYQFKDRLVSLQAPTAPILFEDVVIFTASSSYQRVGISFAGEGYGKVYWFQNLVVPKDAALLAAENPDGTKKDVNPYRDTGILFYVYTIPPGAAAVNYRLVINGLWTTDPLNPDTVRGTGGFTESRVVLPAQVRAPSTYDAPQGSLWFNFSGAPGETVTVAGSFNGWDPYMYKMKETSPGVYALTLSLPPGVYQYVFYYRGERALDPNNPRRNYTRSGDAVSEAIVE